MELSLTLRPLAVPFLAFFSRVNPLCCAGPGWAEGGWAEGLPDELGVGSLAIKHLSRRTRVAFEGMASFPRRADAPRLAEHLPRSLALPNAHEQHK